MLRLEEGEEEGRYFWQVVRSDLKDRNSRYTNDNCLSLSLFLSPFLPKNVRGENKNVLRGCQTIFPSGLDAGIFGRNLIGYTVLWILLVSICTTCLIYRAVCEMTRKKEL